MPLDVLVVDDSIAIRKVLLRVLAQTGARFGVVQEAKDGEEALEAVRNHRFHVIFTDLAMPGMTGLEFLQKLKSRPEYRRVPVIVVSSVAAQSKVVEAVRLGASAFIRKPFNASQIQAKLRELGLLGA